MKKLLAVFMFIFVLPLCAQAAGQRHGFDYSAFAQLPVQHEGRLKPLDSFARTFLTMFSGQSGIDNLSATAWLAELLFDPDAAYGRDVFNVASPACATPSACHRGPNTVIPSSRYRRRLPVTRR